MMGSGLRIFGKDVLAPDLAKVLKESPERINAEDVFDPESR